jgi:hypothetical protein
LQSSCRILHIAYANTSWQVDGAVDVAFAGDSYRPVVRKRFTPVVERNIVPSTLQSPIR